MQLLNFEFKPDLLAIVSTLIAVSVFTYLMIWQLGRAEERELLRLEVIERSQLPVADLSEIGSVSLPENQYRRFQVSGHYINQHQVLLDNVVQDGKPGYQVITPFRTTGNETVLVNRGWITAGRDRRVLPAIEVAENPLQITVMLDKPRSAPVVVNEVVEKNHRWNYLDIEFYRKHTGLNVPDYLLLLEEGGKAAYAAKWPEIEDKGGMHIGYAIQWGAFALIALGTFLGMNIKRVRKTGSND